MFLRFFNLLLKSTGLFRTIFFAFRLFCKLQSGGHFSRFGHTDTEFLQFFSGIDDTVVPHALFQTVSGIGVGFLRFGQNGTDIIEIFIKGVQPVQQFCRCFQDLQGCR